MVLNNSNILLGVTGGIAACKVPLLIRALRVAGATIRVCMTNNAHHFITPLTLQTLTGWPVLNNQFIPEQDDGMDHISLARWADMVVIAPATAGVIARCAQGMADDLLTSLCLASEAPKIMAPAMNRIMWQQPQVQANLDLLRSYGWNVLAVASGEQACGEYGEGRMLEPDTIVDHLVNLNSSEHRLAGVKVVITAGPTREPIDPVRFISNHSSGKMGYALAQAAIQAGAEVTLISGPVTIQEPAGCDLIAVETAEQMHHQVSKVKSYCNIFISCSAVADYQPVTFSQQKIKKNNQEIHLKLQKTVDIVADFAQTKRPDQLVVGFAAETHSVIEYARKKRIQKKLDMIIANRVDLVEQGMNADDNEVTIITEEGEEHCKKADKRVLAAKIIHAVASQYESRAISASSVPRKDNALS